MKEDNGNPGKNTEEKKKNNESALVTKESLGAVGALFSALAFLILITRSLIFGGIGVAVNSFLLGVFGYGAYAFVPALFLASVSAFIGKKIIKNRSAALFILLFLFTALLIVHGAVTASWEQSGYFSACFSSATGGVKTCSPAGWTGGLIVGALFSVAGKAGAFVLLSVALLCFALAAVKSVTGKSVLRSLSKRFFAKKNARQQGETSQDSASAVSAASADSAVSGMPRAGLAERSASYMPYGADGARFADGGANVRTAGNAGAVGAESGAYPYTDTESYGGFPGAAGYEKRNEYGFPAENVRMRPAVTLSKDVPQSADNSAPRAPSSFSPFGSSAYNAETQSGAAGQSARAYNGAAQNGGNLLYDEEAVERFRNNLIFDPNSKFNQRKSAANSPVSSAPVFRSAPSAPSEKAGGRSTDGFGASYTDFYASSVNGENAQSRVVPSGNGKNGSDNYAADMRYSREVSDFSAEAAQGNASATAASPVPPVTGGAFGRDGQDVFNGEAFARKEDSRDGLNGSLRDGQNGAEEFGNGYGGALRSENRADFRGEDGFRNEEDFLGGEFGARERDDLTIFDDEDDGFLRGEEFRVSGGEETDGRDIRADDGFLRDRRIDGDLPRFDTGVSRREEPEADFNRNGFSEADGRGETDGGESRGAGYSAREFTAAETPRQAQSAPQPPKEQQKPQPPRPRRPYRAAPLDYFDCTDTRPDQNATEIEENKQTILDTLEAFKVPDASIASVTCGPTVTRYNVAVPRNISPKKVVALDQPIAMNLHAKNGVNIAPNFEDGTISVEVPNRKRQTVTLGCMIAAEEFINSKPNALVFAMGKNVGNKKEYGDIRKMTHILVAGTSGSGKTAFLHSIIISLIMKYSPADLRLILIDPKKTEFVVYEGLPHLVINEVLSDTNKVIQSLNWAIAEMERRYDLFSKKSRAGTYVIDIDEYNANLAEGEEKLPKIVIIADEVAAMMQDAKKDMEDRIQNLTQKSRATGIHVILATQRPSTDVITGVIKSNLKSRIALSVAQEIDSRVILDESGAQNLLGQGDLLYSTEGTKTPVRMQAPFISSEKAQEVIRYIKENNDCYFDEEAAAYIDKPKQSGVSGAEGAEDDEADFVYIEALRNVILSGSASISLVQRKCSVGYNKAGKIIEWMEDQGYISAFDGAKARKVLITPEQFEEKYGPL
ncbi:MAG: DNA translocase FtsK [Candidatus Scatosoma sp.]